MPEPCAHYWVKSTAFDGDRNLLRIRYCVRCRLVVAGWIDESEPVLNPVLAGEIEAILAEAPQR